jgi:CheY-like chemotaxis protein
VIDADAVLFALLDEWLADAGCALERWNGGAPPRGPFDLALADLPYPRRGGHDLLKQIGLGHFRMPVVALSSNFFPGVEGSRAVAKALGVAAVLPKPVTREALLAALGELCPAPG